MPRVNWGGLPPHKEHLRNPQVQEMIDQEDVNRANYIEKKERTENAKRKKEISS